MKTLNNLFVLVLIIGVVFGGAGTILAACLTRAFIELYYTYVIKPLIIWANEN